jgi:hypothetical protein
MRHGHGITKPEIICNYQRLVDFTANLCACFTTRDIVAEHHRALKYFAQCSLEVSSALSRGLLSEPESASHHLGTDKRVKGHVLHVSCHLVNVLDVVGEVVLGG